MRFWLLFFYLIYAPGRAHADKNVHTKSKAKPKSLFDSDPTRPLQPPYDFVPNEGFGLQKKSFISKEQLPQAIQKSIIGAVRKVCICEATPPSCATFFAFEKDSQFITNEHVASGFYDKIRETIEEHKKNNQPCSPEVFLIEPDGTYSPVEITPIKRGLNQAKDLDVLGADKKWNPREYYKTGPEDHSEDLTIFSIKGFKTPVAPLKAASELRKEQPVYQIGYSAAHLIEYEKAGKDFFPQVSSGSLLEIKEKNLETDSLGVPGMSGGPLLDESGALLGVFWGKRGTMLEMGGLFNVDGREWIRRYGHPRERAFFIPLDKVRSFLDYR